MKSVKKITNDFKHKNMNFKAIFNPLIFLSLIFKEKSFHISETSKGADIKMKRKTIKDEKNKFIPPKILFFFNLHIKIKTMNLPKW